MSSLPDLIAEAQMTEERFPRQIFVRDRMAEWSKHPLIMARADGVYYWDVAGKRYLSAEQVDEMVAILATIPADVLNDPSYRTDAS